MARAPETWVRISVAVRQIFTSQAATPHRRQRGWRPVLLMRLRTTTPWRRRPRAGAGGTRRARRTLRRADRRGLRHEREHLRLRRERRIAPQTALRRTYAAARLRIISQRAAYRDARRNGSAGGRRR